MVFTYEPLKIQSGLADSPPLLHSLSIFFYKKYESDITEISLILLDLLKNNSLLIGTEVLKH